MERRNTIQKELVLNAVKEMHRHVTADEVCAFIRGTHPSVGKGTVYRNLGILADENKIRRVDVTDGPSRFDPRTDKHYHVQCAGCGAVFDVDMAPAEDLESRIRDRHGFLILGHEILFKGICPECRAKEMEEANG